ncbi:MAG: CTP synthetase, partial [Pelagibacteraceae bacterium]
MCLIKKASSTEISKQCIPIVGLIDEWSKNGKVQKGTSKNLGGTMRLGLYPARLKESSLIK